MANHARTNKRTDRGNLLITDKSCYEDSRLKWGSKGVHAYIIGKPDGWTMQLVDLEKHGKGGRDFLRACIRDLIKHGYVSRLKISQGQGKGFDWVTDFWEFPEDNVLFMQHQIDGELPEDKVALAAKGQLYGTRDGFSVPSENPLETGFTTLVDHDSRETRPYNKQETTVNKKTSITSVIDSQGEQKRFTLEEFLAAYSFLPQKDILETAKQLGDTTEVWERIHAIESSRDDYRKQIEKRYNYVTGGGSERQAIRESVFEICKLKNAAIKRNLRSANSLVDVIVESEASIEEFESWWYKHDFRGQRNQPPTVDLIMAVWPSYEQNPTGYKEPQKTQQPQKSTPAESRLTKEYIEANNARIAAHRAKKGVTMHGKPIAQGVK